MKALSLSVQKLLPRFFFYVLRFRLAFKSINITINLNKYFILYNIIMLNCGFSIVRSAFHYNKTLNLFRVLNVIDASSVVVGLCLLCLSLIRFCFCRWLASSRKESRFCKSLLPVHSLSTTSPM